MFPRFVKECCDGHLSKNDVVVMNSIRKDVDRDVMETGREQDGSVNFLKWWEVLGFENDMTPEKTKRMGIVDKDGVHLTDLANRKAAGYFCLRVSGDRTCGSRRGGDAKRTRWERNHRKIKWR